MAASAPLILIVDDNLDAREMYGMYLQHEGFRWAEAVNGHDAITQTQLEKAVADPDGRDHAAHGWLGSGAHPEAGRRHQDIPLIMLTAHAFQEHRDRAVEVGADGFLAKPVLPDQLAARSGAFSNSVRCAITPTNR